MAPLRRLVCICSALKVVQYLKSLKHLRTLHVRNLPPLDADGVPSWPGISDDERCEGFVAKLVRALVKLHPVRPPILETVALGILRYKDIFAGIAAQHDDKKLDGFLRLRVYHVEYHHNFQGDCIPIVTLISKGTTDDIEHSCHNVKILESEWMA